MTEKENHLQHRLTKEEFYDFLKECRDKSKTSLHYNFDEWFLKHYLEHRGVILPPDIAFYEMNHTFKNSFLMRSLDEIMKDATRYYTVFIEKYASVIDAVLQNGEHQGQEYFYVSEKTVKDILSQFIEKLKYEIEYFNEAAFGFHYSLLSTAMRGEFGDLLVEIKYNEIFNIVETIGKVKPQDALDCNDLYVLTMITLNTTVYYSCISQRFALYLADIGLLTTLTSHITEAGYLNYLHKESLSRMVDYILLIVHNIAYHSDFEPKQKFDATKRALMNFPKVDNNFKELLIMMSLVYTMDAHELGLLSDESNVINTTIQYMQVALDDKYRFYVLTLCQLADGLTKLTINSSKSSKIVHTEGALSALVNMLRYKDVKENESAVRCIHALAQDREVRNTLLEFKDLVHAMVDLRKTTSLKLKKIIDDTLKNLSSSTPETQDIRVQGQSLPAAMHQLAIGVKNSFPHKSQTSPQICFNVFLLDQSTHVTNGGQQEEQFTAKGKSEKLKPEDEQTIRRHWLYLIEELDGTQIIDNLYYTGVFDADDRREIMSHVTHKKRTEIMLEKLLNAGPTAFQNFLYVLEKDHKFIANELRE